MPTLIIRLNPQLLDNPDADIRYQLPELLTERSGSGILYDGYDYVGSEPFLVIFLNVSDTELALVDIIDVIENVSVLGNNLQLAAVVAIDHDGKYEVVYPLGFVGSIM